MRLHRRGIASGTFFQALYQTLRVGGYAALAECLIQDGAQCVVAPKCAAYRFPFGVSGLYPAAVDRIAVSEYFVGGKFAVAEPDGGAGAEYAFGSQVVVAFVGADIENVADAAVGRGHNLQAVEQDFRLFAVIFIHINVKPAVRVRIGQRRQFGGMFFKFAGGGFFGRFAVAGVDRRVFLAEAGGKGRADSQGQNQKDGAAHKFLQIENGFILWFGGKGCKQSGYNLT